MIQLHQFLVYVLKYLAEDDQITNDCSEYITLKISPHHIHKTKAEHNLLLIRITIPFLKMLETPYLILLQGLKMKLMHINFSNFFTIFLIYYSRYFFK